MATAAPSAVHSQTADALGSVATSHIRVPGLAAPIRVLHITDSHIDLGPDAESGSLELCEYLHGRYVGGFKANEQRGEGTVHNHPARDPIEAFEAQVGLAASRDCDLIVHTGDLLNFPSPKAAAYAAETFQKTGRPFLFVAGNHDWQHCPLGLDGVAHGSDTLRTEWRAKALQPLFAAGMSMSHWSRDVPAGLRFIGLDNSTNYITPAQLAFFRGATAGLGLKIVLLMHIPLPVPELLEETGRGDGGAQHDIVLCWSGRDNRLCCRGRQRH
eukprot:SAG22_NODE_1783_length_3591_cov_1.767182_1_plen_271_part_00